MLSGALLIDKPADLTSHDVVARVRKIVNQKRVGHTGTLDPFATGLLIIVLGPATRLIEYTHLLPKTYLAEFTLGATSDTDDSTGAIKTFPSLRRRGSFAEGEDGVVKIKTTLQNFTGQITQTPPAYSAIKINGRRAYAIARAKASGVGESPRLSPRQVTIHKIKLLAYKYPKINLLITCGTGTYIRALARDLGQSLQTGAYCSQLRRTQIGTFHIKQALTLDQLSTGLSPSCALAPESLVSHLPKTTLTALNVAKLQAGQSIELPREELNRLPLQHPIAVFNPQNQLISISQISPPLLQPRKIIIPP